MRFLKHLERVRVLCHLIEPGEDLWKRYQIIRKELAEFNPELIKVPELVVLTKLDIISKSQRTIFTKKKIPVMEISAVTGQGIEDLKMKLWSLIQ